VRDPLTTPTVARAHVVREGETLSEIAAATLGSSRRWPELVAANRDRISDPDRVLPGTELRIPATSAQ
jgi:nucleoid-associated protein YgaU